MPGTTLEMSIAYWVRLSNPAGALDNYILIAQMRRPRNVWLPSSMIRISSQYLPLDWSRLPQAQSGPQQIITQDEVGDKLKKMRKKPSSLPGI